MKICIVSDTWNNINGVVTTMKALVHELKNRGHDVLIIEPSLFKTISPWFYPDNDIAINFWKTIDLIEEFQPDAIHISTEGTLGFAARWYCKIKKNNIPHNTSYHTKFPEYLKIHTGLPLKCGYSLMRLFHKFSQKILVTTNSMKRELEAQGFKNLVVWSRGVDRSIFNNAQRVKSLKKEPILLCVSRASKEKGLDDFCSLKTNGIKILIGDGPYLDSLRQKYPDVLFLGFKKGQELAYYYVNADVFVFPSKSDTFGVVMLEAMACGTPIAAYPVTGPIDVINEGVTGYMDLNLDIAIQKCLTLDRQKVIDNSNHFSWEKTTDIFLENLVLIKKE
jgi:glycosyltransferase involved in cell wall biosynthesis